MMKLAIALTTALLTASACNRSEPAPAYPAPQAQATVTDEEVARRDQYTVTVKARLTRIDEQLRELANRTDAESREAVARLRVKYDELEARIEKAGNYAENNWEQFENDVSRGFQELENDLDRAF